MRVMGPWAVSLVVIMALVAACKGGGSDALPTPLPSSGPGLPDATPAVVTGDGEEADVPRLADVEAGSWHPETRSEELAVALEGATEITPQQAVDILGLSLPGLPGQTPSSLPPGDGFGDSVTLHMALGFRDRLSAAQQAVVDPYIDPGTPAATILSDGTIVRRDGPGESPLEGVHNLRQPTGPPVDDYATILVNQMARWDEHLPFHPDVTVDLTFLPAGAPGDGTFAMDATTGAAGVCAIRVYHSWWAGPGSTADATGFVFAHELFHCFQAKWNSAASAWPPGWVIEGGADWAAADLYRGTGSTNWFSSLGWFSLPQAPLSARSYSAWALWEAAHNHGIDVYLAMTKVVSNPGSSVAASIAVGGLDGLLFRRFWSTSATRTSIWGKEWSLPFPIGNPDDPTAPTLTTTSRGVGTYNIVGPGKFAHMGFRVEMVDVDRVEVTPVGGPLTTVTALGTTTVAEGSTGVFCFAGHQCACPGDAPNGFPMLDAEMVFSFAAGWLGTTAAVRAQKWNPDNCPSPGSDPGGGGFPDGDGHSNGDPHLRTFDGLPYDVMTLGEFVITRDPVDGLEVQTRHEPFGDGAGTTAVAIGAGLQRITFSRPGFDLDGLVVRVDGAVVTESEIDVGPAHASEQGGGWLVTWPDGSAVRLSWFFGWFVDVHLSPERAGRAEGLLGAADGDLTNDLVMRDGSHADTSDAAEDESPFVLQWAVDDRTTLFDYEAGQSAQTFRVPRPQPALEDADQTFFDACAEVLGDHATSDEIRSCAFDVAATGETGFVSVYADVVAERVAGDPDLVIVSDAPPDAGPSDGAASQAGQPTITLGGDVLEGSVEVTAGTVLLVKMELCPEGEDVDVEVRVAGQDDLLARAALCDPSGLPGIGGSSADEWIDGEAYVWLPGDGTYDVSVLPLRATTVIGGVALYTDPSPTIVRATDLGSGGDEQQLTGIGDTVVYLTDPAAVYSAAGLDIACAVEVYWGDQFPRREPLDLARCEHNDRIDFPPTDRTIPLVVFARTADPVSVRLARE